MRHFLLTALAVVVLAVGVITPTMATALVALASGAHRLPARLRCALR